MSLRDDRGEWVKENVSTTVDPPTITEGTTFLQF